MRNTRLSIATAGLLASLALPSAASATDMVTVVFPVLDEQESGWEASTFDTQLSIFYTGHERGSDTVANVYLYDERDGGLLRGDNEELGFPEICNPCTFTVGSSGVNEFDLAAQLSAPFVRRRDVSIEQLVTANNGGEWFKNRELVRLSAVIEIVGSEADRVFVTGMTILQSGEGDLSALTLQQFRFDDGVEQQLLDLESSVASIDDSVAYLEDSVADLQETTVANHASLQGDHDLISELIETILDIL